MVKNLFMMTFDNRHLVEKNLAKKISGRQVKSPFLPSYLGTVTKASVTSIECLVT